MHKRKPKIHLRVALQISWGQSQFGMHGHQPNVLAIVQLNVQPRKATC